MVFQEETVKILKNLPYNKHTKLINMNINNMYKESKVVLLMVFITIYQKKKSHVI